MIIEMQNCPNCHHILEIRILGLASGLGPSEINCLKCGQRFQTGRVEWWEMAEMPIFARVWFFSITLIYIAVLGLLTGNFVDQSFQLWNLDPVIVNLRYQSTPFHVGAYIGCFAVVLLQVYRVIASIRRSRVEYKLTTSEFFLGLQWNLQLKCLVVLFAIWGVAQLRYHLATQ